MIHVLTLWLALFAPQATTPSDTPAAQQPSSTPDTQQTAPAKAPRPNPDASGKYHIGDGVTPPRLTHGVEPVFPQKARKQKFSGKTVVSLIIDANGKPVDVHVKKSIADSMDEKLHDVALSLDQAALDAVRQYSFAPATFQGKPIPVELNVEVNFQIF
jgi:TonB family protein